MATEVKSDYFRRCGSAAAVSRKIGHFRHHGSTMAVKNFYNLWMIRAFAAKKIKKKIYCLGISVAMEMSRKIGLLPSPR